MRLALPARLSPQGLSRCLLNVSWATGNANKWALVNNTDDVAALTTDVLVGEAAYNSALNDVRTGRGPLPLPATSCAHSDSAACGGPEPPFHTAGSVATPRKGVQLLVVVVGDLSSGDSCQGRVPGTALASTSLRCRTAATTSGCAGGNSSSSSRRNSRRNGSSGCSVTPNTTYLTASGSSSSCGDGVEVAGVPLPLFWGGVAGCHCRRRAAPPLGPLGAPGCGSGCRWDGCRRRGQQDSGSSGLGHSSRGGVRLLSSAAAAAAAAPCGGAGGGAGVAAEGCGRRPVERAGDRRRPEVQRTQAADSGASRRYRADDDCPGRTDGPGPGSGSASAAAGRDSDTDTAAAAAAAALSDLTRPASWYSLARSMRRKVVAHLGPTNSGKTHAALQALKAAPSGIYCGPLRLLACEVADRLAAEGVPCQLVTGQEIRLVTATTSTTSTTSSTPPSARHTSCTIEMADVTSASPWTGTGTGPVTRGSAAAARASVHDVAVLDEIQMLGDPLRGWAWTRALLGLAAAEVHVAGDPGVLPLLRALVGECGDELEVRRYRRLSPLVVQAEALGGLAAVGGGDCLVAFSRRALHGLRREVVRRTGREACLVYGALPPEARRQQAALFNATPPPPSSPPGPPGDDGADGTTTTTTTTTATTTATTTRAAEHRGRRPGAPHLHPHPHPHPHDARASGKDWGPEPRSEGTEPEHGSGSASESGSRSGSGPGSRVLCASDAIGMGLNLNIRRVVFTSLHKYDGASVRPLQPSEVRQIAGRAGRFSSPHPTGHVTTLRPRDLTALHRALSEPPEPITRACLLPSSEHLAAYAALTPQRPLATSLLAFAATARLGASYMYGNYDGMYRISSALRELGGSGAMSPEELLLFSTAPADMDDPAVASALIRFAQLYVREGRVGPEDITDRPLPHSPPASETELKRLEELHRVYDLYVWLCYRLPYAFRGREAAEAARVECGALIEAGLDRIAAAAAFGRRNHHHHHHSYHNDHSYSDGLEDECEDDR